MIFRNKFFLLFILSLGLSLRLINLSEWFHFEFDEEVIVWKLRPFLQEGKWFLIGGGTPFGFHLGPAFYYLSSIPLKTFNLDPIGWGWMAAVFGVITIWLCWLVGKTLYNRRVGLIFALLWATSFTAVMTDRHWWPLVLDSLLSLVVILCLYKIYVIPAKAGIYLNRFRVKRFDRLLESERPRSRRPELTAEGHGMTWIVLGLTLAFAWQADLTVLPLFLASAAVALSNWRSQKKGAILAVLIILISVLPLVLFELRHPGANIGKLTISSSRSNLCSLQRLDLCYKSVGEAVIFVPQSLSRLLFPISHLDGNLLKFYSWCKEIADSRVAGQPWWAAGLTGFLLLIPFISRLSRNELNTKARSLDSVYPEFIEGLGMTLEADRVLRIVILSGAAGIIMFRLRGGNLYDFYLAVLYPVLLLLTARAVDFIWRKWGKIAAIVGLTVMVGLNLTTIVNAYHPQGLALKRQAVAWAISNVGKEEFDLESISNCSRYNGVRYLFWLVGKEPQQSFVDPELGWLYDKKGDYMKPKFLVTFTTPNDLTPDQKEKYDQLKQKAVNSGIFSSDLEVIISTYD